MNKNRKIMSSNTSGCTGVAYHQKANKWLAYANQLGKRKHLGLFESKDDAILARKNFDDLHTLPEYKKITSIAESLSRLDTNQLQVISDYINSYITKSDN